MHAPKISRQLDEDRHGRVMLFTGDGKGKTTAALGCLLRAWGWGWRVAVVQFIKEEGGDWGEARAADRLGVEWYTTGSGFTWETPDLADTAARARAAWAQAQTLIASGEYDLVMLDEVTYALAYGWIDQRAAVEWLRQHRPPHTTLVFTGRSAPQPLADYADLVTEMRCEKHPYQAGAPSQRGLEF